MTDDNAEDPAAPTKAHPHRHLAYMSPTAKLTLREGLEEYYGAIEGLFKPEDMSDDMADLFRFHDTCHVLFGCDTSIHGEALVDTWSIFGTTVTLKTYKKYLDFSGTQSLFKNMTFEQMLEALSETATSTPKAFWRATHMTHKWPFRDHEQYMDRPLDELRAEFGIDVIE